MPKTVTLRVDDKTYETLARRARVEKRPLSNFIEVAAMEHALRSEFADDDEMREILANELLMSKLREGSKQAKKRRGRFVA